MLQTHVRREGLMLRRGRVGRRLLPVLAREVPRQVRPARGRETSVQASDAQREGVCAGGGQASIAVERVGGIAGEQASEGRTTGHGVPV